MQHAVTRESLGVENTKTLFAEWRIFRIKCWEERTRDEAVEFRVGRKISQLNIMEGVSRFTKAHVVELLAGGPNGRRAMCEKFRGKYIVGDEDVAHPHICRQHFDTIWPIRFYVGRI